MINLYSKHRDWLRYVIHLGATKRDAKDIVSQMYLRILNKLNSGLNIDYEDSFNHMYITNTLRSLFIDQKRKDKSEILTLRIDGNGNVVAMNKEGMFLNAKPVKSVFYRSTYRNV